MNSKPIKTEVGPKSLSYDEIYGECDLNKKQWHSKLCYSNLSMNNKKMEINN